MWVLDFTAPCRINGSGKEALPAVTGRAFHCVSGLPPSASGPRVLCLSPWNVKAAQRRNIGKAEVRAAGGCDKGLPLALPMESVQLALPHGAGDSRCSAPRGLVQDTDPFLQSRRCGFGALSGGRGRLLSDFPLFPTPSPVFKRNISLGH